eukprot:TRINITY_DN28513_c0_g1_i1.p1 TRINITY_DN28513_c0_g1~~TRINITY_DN28513_c0_g1_i1.p1  ORF type:complete len:418 (+),score=86.67 TRINITY_DN28513_c0_g1_i1:102-1355(+)
MSSLAVPDHCLKRQRADKQNADSKVLTFFMNGDCKLMPRNFDMLADESEPSEPRVVTTFSMDGRFFHSVRPQKSSLISQPLVLQEPPVSNGTASAGEAATDIQAEEAQPGPRAANKRTPLVAFSVCPDGKEDEASPTVQAAACSQTGKALFTVRAHKMEDKAMMRLNLEPVTCTICCGETPSWQAAYFACQHGWYCKQCIARFAEESCNDGLLPCPECRAPVDQHEVRQLLPAELIERLLARGLEQVVAASENLFTCPTPNCPMRVEVGKGRLGRLRCKSCKKESCVRCGAQPFHTGLTCDQHADKLRSRRQCKEANDSDASFIEWLEKTGSRKCPGCRMAISKQDLDTQTTQESECHKMLCRCCGTRFCFQCLSVLTDTFTCGCTINAHGFVNPHTGRRLQHLRRTANKRKLLAAQ